MARARRDQPVPSREHVVGLANRERHPQPSGPVDEPEVIQFPPPRCRVPYRRPVPETPAEGAALARSAVAMDYPARCDRASLRRDPIAGDLGALAI